MGLEFHTRDYFVSPLDSTQLVFFSFFFLFLSLLWMRAVRNNKVQLPSAVYCVCVCILPVRHTHTRLCCMCLLFFACTCCCCQLCFHERKQMEASVELPSFIVDVLFSRFGRLPSFPAPANKKKEIMPMDHHHTYDTIKVIISYKNKFHDLKKNSNLKKCMIHRVYIIRIASYFIHRE